jgi:transcriptional regulator with XRE-family HTH domain
MSGNVRGIAYPLWERVETARALKGWSSVRLHRETGVSRSTVAKLATQPKPPLPSTVCALADALGIPREEALKLSGFLGDARLPPPVADDDALPDMTRAERRWVIEKIQEMRASERRTA